MPEQIEPFRQCDNIPLDISVCVPGTDIADLLAARDRLYRWNVRFS